MPIQEICPHCRLPIPDGEHNCKATPRDRKEREIRDNRKDLKPDLDH